MTGLQAMMLAMDLIDRGVQIANASKAAMSEGNRELNADELAAVHERRKAAESRFDEAFGSPPSAGDD